MVSYVQIVTNIDGCKVVCSLPQSNKCDEIIMFVANIVTMSGLALETAQLIIFIHTLCSVLSTAFVLGIHFLKIQLL